MRQRSTKKTILDTIAIFCVKRIANCFWDIADNWSYKNEKIAQLYDKTISEEYRKEYERCDISSKKNVVHIGSGSYPLTEIILASCSVSHVVGIDKNLQTVTKAQQVVQRKKLADRISIQHGDGCNIAAEEFDAIIISSCSLPKVKILQHIFQRVKPNTTIIVREVDIATKDIFSCLASYPEITLETQINHNPFPFIEPFGWTSFCLQKK
ncbi:MAG: methyltransferase domain-containing protein [Candidatus Thermoplasmatota archaeon]|nr:methyltransferase domain-containing protein [Candidatus Thermoplasmatota archaeon]